MKVTIIRIFSIPHGYLQFWEPNSDNKFFFRTQSMVLSYLINELYEELLVARWIY